MPSVGFLRALRELPGSALGHVVLLVGCASPPPASATPEKERIRPVAEGGCGTTGGHCERIAAEPTSATAEPLQQQSVAPASAAEAPQDPVRSANARCELGYREACIEALNLDCKRGDDEKCLKLGVKLSRGEAADPETAAAIFGKLCDSIDETRRLDDLSQTELMARVTQATGCRMLGSMRGDARDEIQMAALYRKACLNLDVNGCVLLGDRYYRTGDRPKALDLYQVACDGGNMLGCRLQGAVLIDGGRWREAYPLEEKACLAEIPAACALQGKLLCEGKGVAKDLTRGVRVLAAACNRGDAIACGYLSASYTDGSCCNRDLMRAAELADRACKLGNMNGCVSLAGAFATGSGVSADRALARALAEQACRSDAWDFGMQRGRVIACSMAVLAYRDPAAGPAADATVAELRAIGCHSGDAKACADAGNAQLVGQGVPRDVDSGLAFLDRACGLQHRKACEIAAMARKTRRACQQVSFPQCAEWGF